MFDVTWLIALWSISGNVFNIKKKVACFYIWAIGEIVWAFIDIKNGVFGRAFLDFVQLGFAIWGIYEWQFKNKVGDKNAKKKLKRASARNFKNR